MTRTTVVTDSAACLPGHLIRRHDIRVVPFELVAARVAGAEEPTAGAGRE